MNHQIYSNVIEILSLRQKHQTSLLKRGFTLQQIETNQYRTLLKTGIPAKTIHSLQKTVEKLGLSLTDVPGFYLEKGRKNPDIVKPFYTIKKGDDKKYCDSILVPVRNRSGEIQAFKVRLDTKISTRKYKYLSSKGYPKGKGHQPQIHWPLGFSSDIDTIRVTEGEFKADYTTINTQTYTISIPGVTMWRLALKEIKRLPNIKKVLLAPDSDKTTVDGIDPYTGKKLRRNQVNSVARSFACLAHELMHLGFEVFMEDWDESLGKGIDDVILGNNQPKTMNVDELEEFIQANGKPLFPHSIETSTGHRLLPTKENAKALADFVGIEFKYNAMKHHKEVHGNNQSEFYPSNFNNTVHQFRSRASMYGMPQASLADLVELLSADNTFHPARDWIESEEWDGVSRTQDLMETLTVEQGWEATRDIYIKRWLISGIAALYARNFWTKICLVLVGDGSIGKTTWFEKLFGSIAKEAFKDGLILDPSNKDSRFVVISNWCVELGELSATFRKRDREELKAFISERADDFRPPYGREPINYPRQCFFAASVDQAEFLKDEAGDIRFACLPVTDINLDHDINMQQLWLEVRNTWFANGQTWFLDGEELSMIKNSNELFRVADQWEELLFEAYGAPDIAEQAGFKVRYLSSRQICDEMNSAGYTNKSADEIVMKVSRILKKYYPAKKKSPKSKVSAQFNMPPIKDKNGPDLLLIKGGKSEADTIEATDEVMNNPKNPETI